MAWNPKTWVTGDQVNATELNRIEDGVTLVESDVAVIGEAVYVEDPAYGAVGDDSTNDTTAIQAAFDAAYAGGGGDVIFQPRRSYRITQLAKTFTGFPPKPVNLVGGGRLSTKLKKFGAGTTPLISFLAETPFVTKSDIRDLSIIGTSKAHDGIKFDACAYWTLQNVDIESCDKAIHNLGGLTARLENCVIQSNNSGIYNRLSAQGGGPPPNLVRVRDCVIGGNTSAGIDHGSGQHLIITGGDFEANGTAANTATGAITVQNTIDDATGYGMVLIRDTWFESNLGRTIQSAAGDLILDGVTILSPESNRSVYGRGLRQLAMKSCHLPSAGDKVDVDSTVVLATFEDCVIASIASVASARTQYHNVQTSSEYIIERLVGSAGTDSVFEASTVGDTFPRAQFLANGTFKMGSGSAAPDWEMSRTAASVVKTLDRMIFDLGIGVGNNQGASEVIGKAVSAKIAVYDGNGSLLGYLPVYSSIT